MIIIIIIILVILMLVILILVILIIVVILIIILIIRKTITATHRQLAKVQNQRIEHTAAGQRLLQ